MLLYILIGGDTNEGENAVVGVPTATPSPTKMYSSMVKNGFMDV